MIFRFIAVSYSDKKRGSEGIPPEPNIQYYHVIRYVFNVEVCPPFKH